MFAVQEQYCGFVVAHLIAHPVVADPDAVFILFPSQLDAPARAWVLFERDDPPRYATACVVRQAV